MAALVGGTPRPVVLYVISPAGKPVWCSDTSVSEDALSPTCGVLTAVVALAEDCGDEVVGLVAGRSRVALVRRGELLLVAVGAVEECDAALRSYVAYAHDAICMVRGAAGHVLVSAQKAAAERCPSALYGILFCGGRLVAAAQPKCRGGDASRRLRSVDVLLLLNFVESQKKALLESESWTPVCLPRFNDRGFLHAYVAYVDGDSGLCLALLAGDNAPETFETFHGARRAIESALRRDGVLAAAARAAAQPADARLADLLPADCLHCAVACRETGADPPGAYLEDPGPRPPKQALAQCAATQAFEPERTWREYERLAARCAPPAPAAAPTPRGTRARWPSRRAAASPTSRCRARGSSSTRPSPRALRAFVDVDFARDVFVTHVSFGGRCHDTYAWRDGDGVAHGDVQVAVEGTASAPPRVAVEARVGKGWLDLGDFKGPETCFEEAAAALGNAPGASADGPWLGVRCRALRFRAGGAPLKVAAYGRWAISHRERRYSREWAFGDKFGYRRRRRARRDLADQLRDLT
ncbi:hypothetical protein JL721_10373 [Aureococcus anophagefferens]|nr:hypothetical protein JL721_10373 [Aureococcus anophagefferens]